MKLETYLSKQGISETAFAATVGVKQPTINRYVRDQRFPDPEMIERIAKATGGRVTVGDWYVQDAEHRAAKERAA